MWTRSSGKAFGRPAMLVLALVALIAGAAVAGCPDNTCKSNQGDYQCPDSYCLWGLGWCSGCSGGHNCGYNGCACSTTGANGCIKCSKANAKCQTNRPCKLKKYRCCADRRCSCISGTYCATASITRPCPSTGNRWCDGQNTCGSIYADLTCSCCRNSSCAPGNCSTLAQKSLNTCYSGCNHRSSFWNCLCCFECRGAQNTAIIPLSCQSGCNSCCDPNDPDACGGDGGCWYTGG